MTTYLGQVSCDLHKCSSRVRVSIDGTDGIPLSVKASLNDFPRKLFVKGAVVEVEQCQHDGRKFRVTRIFEAVKKPVIGNFHVQCESAEDFKKRADEERVRFYLGLRYFENPDLQAVLNRTLGVMPEEFHQIKRSDTGVTFICTTDQFARFLIDRNLNGIKNGFMDLSAKLICPEPKPDAYQTLADLAGITRGQAKKVALAVSYSLGDLEDRLPEQQRLTPCMVDVSDRR